MIAIRFCALRKFGVHKHVFSSLDLFMELSACQISKIFSVFRLLRTPFSSSPPVDLEQCGKYGGKLDCSYFFVFAIELIRFHFNSDDYD